MEYLGYKDPHFKMLMCIVGLGGHSGAPAEGHKLTVLLTGSLVRSNRRGTGLTAWLPLARNMARPLLRTHHLLPRVTDLCHLQPLQTAEATWSPPWYCARHRHGHWHEAEFPTSKCLLNTKIPILEPLNTTTILFLMHRILGGTIILS